MTTRQQQIEAIAATIANYSEEFTTAEDLAAEANRGGWTFDTTAPLGHTIRHEGVVLTDSELERATNLAQANR